MFNKNLGMKEKVEPKGFNSKLLSSILYLALTSAPLVTTLSLNGCYGSSDTKYTPSTTNSTQPTTNPTGNDTITDKFFPIKVLFKTTVNGDILLRSDAIAMEYNYYMAEKKPYISWEPLNKIREVKEYLYTLDNANWISTGTNTFIQITTPISNKTWFFNVKAVFEDGTESYTSGLEFSIVAEIDHGLKFEGPYNEKFYSILKLADGFLAVGTQQAILDNPQLVNTNTLLNRYTKDFKLVWSKIIGGTHGGWDSINMTKASYFASEQVIETPDNHYMLLMRIESEDGMFSGNKGNGDIGVVKINKDTGNISQVKMLGTMNYDTPYKIIPLTDGNYLLLWTSRVNNSEQICFTKIDSNFNTIFEKILPEVIDFYFYNIMTADGLLVFNTNYKLSNDLSVKKYDFDGNLAADVPLKAIKWLYGAKKLKNGNNLVYGANPDLTPWIMEIDNNLNILTDKNFIPGSKFGNLSVIELENGNLSISINILLDNKATIWVAELDASRNPIWEKYIGDFPGKYYSNMAPKATLCDKNAVVVLSNYPKLNVTRVENNSIIWEKILDFLPDKTEVTSLTTDYDENILIALTYLGNFGKNVLILKINKDNGDLMN